MRKLPLLAAVSVVLIVGQARAAAPPSRPGYQINLGNYPVAPTFAPSQVPMWLDSTAPQTNPDGTTFWLPRPVSDQTPMPVAVVAGGNPGGGGSSGTVAAPNVAGGNATASPPAAGQTGAQPLSLDTNDNLRTTATAPGGGALATAAGQTPPTSTITPTAVSVTTSSTSLIAAGAAAKRLDFFNVSGSGVVWVTPIGGTVTAAAVGVGYPIPPGAGYSFPGTAVPINAWAAISASGTNTMTVWAGN